MCATLQLHKFAQMDIVNCLRDRRLNVIVTTTVNPDYVLKTRPTQLIISTATIKSRQDVAHTRNVFLGSVLHLNVSH